jgi:hypothetical protein
MDEEWALEADEDYGRFGGPGALTDEQATSIGRLLLSRIRASPRLSTLGKVVQSVGPLREMATRYDWFVPMMEVVVKRWLPMDQPSIRNRLMSRMSFLGADNDVLNSFDSVDATDIMIASQTLCRRLELQQFCVELFHRYRKIAVWTYTVHRVNTQLRVNSCRLQLNFSGPLEHNLHSRHETKLHTDQVFLTGLRSRN